MASSSNAIHFEVKISMYEFRGVDMVIESVVASTYIKVNLGVYVDTAFGYLPIDTYV